MMEPRKQASDDKVGSDAGQLVPEEVEIYINPDGSVTFADLSEGALPIARDLAPKDPLVCDVDEPPTDQTPGL